MWLFGTNYQDIEKTNYNLILSKIICLKRTAWDRIAHYGLSHEKYWFCLSEQPLPDCDLFSRAESMGKFAHPFLRSRLVLLSYSLFKVTIFLRFCKCSSLSYVGNNIPQQTCLSLGFYNHPPLLPQCLPDLGIEFMLLICHLWMDTPVSCCSHQFNHLWVSMKGSI